MRRKLVILPKIIIESTVKFCTYSSAKLYDSFFLFAQTKLLTVLGDSELVFDQSAALNFNLVKP